MKFQSIEKVIINQCEVIASRRQYTAQIFEITSMCLRRTITEIRPPNDFALDPVCLCMCIYIMTYLKIKNNSKEPYASKIKQMRNTISNLKPYHSHRGQT